MTFYPPDSSETRHPLIVTTVFGVLAVLSCVARLCSIRLRNETPHLEEYLVFGALFFVLCSLGIQWACVVYGGVGRHTADLASLDDLTLTLKAILPFEALYAITLMLAKLSVLVFYTKIFSSAAPSWFRWGILFNYGYIVCWMLSVVLETFLMCRPLAFNWDTTIDGVCGDRNKIYVSAGATNMASDIMILLLPLPCIWSLQMPLAKRLSLMFIFGLGFFITAISIIRIFSLLAISFDDPTWTLPMGLMWTVLEPELVIINGNLPFLRAIIARCMPRGLTFFSRTPRAVSKPSDFERLDDGLSGRNKIMLRTIGGGLVTKTDVSGEHGDTTYMRNNSRNSSNNINNNGNSRVSDKASGSQTGIMRTMEVYVEVDDSQSDHSRDHHLV